MSDEAVLCVPGRVSIVFRVKNVCRECAEETAMGKWIDRLIVHACSSNFTER